MNKSDFERQISALIPRPDPSVTAALYMWNHCAPQKAAKLADEGYLCRSRWIWS